jgi:acetyltransferase-like isoleucine patch superfamily enzyme
MNPFDEGYYAEDELRQMGFGRVGTNVQIAKKCTVVGLKNIEIGSNVRIDDFTTIIATGSALLKIGSYVHIAGYCLLSANHGLTIGDFAGLSHGVKIYSGSDDYSGEYLTNPMVPNEFKRIESGLVSIGRHVIVGSGSVVLPKVQVGEGAAIGALSLVNKSLDGWAVYFGTPARKLKARSRKLLDLEQKVLGNGQGSKNLCER